MLASLLLCCPAYGQQSQILQECTHELFKQLREIEPARVMAIAKVTKLSSLSARLGPDGAPIRRIQGRRLPESFPAQRIEVRWKNTDPWVTCDTVNKAPSYIGDLHSSALAEVRECPGIFAINSGNYNFQYGIPENSDIGLRSLSGGTATAEVMAAKIKHCKLTTDKDSAGEFLNSTSAINGRTAALAPIEVSWVAKYRTMESGSTFWLRYTGWRQLEVYLKSDL